MPGSTLIRSRPPPTRCCGGDAPMVTCGERHRCNGDRMRCGRRAISTHACTALLLAVLFNDDIERRVQFCERQCFSATGELPPVNFAGRRYPAFTHLPRDRGRGTLSELQGFRPKQLPPRTTAIRVTLGGSSPVEPDDSSAERTSVTPRISRCRNCRSGGSEFGSSVPITCRIEDHAAGPRQDSCAGCINHRTDPAPRRPGHPRRTTPRPSTHRQTRTTSYTESVGLRHHRNRLNLGASPTGPIRIWKPR